MFRIGGNTFYDRKNKILMKILEFKRSVIALIKEFRGIPNRFPNHGLQRLAAWGIRFSHSWVAVSLLEFASELSFGLFFGVIGDHGRRYTIALEYKG